MSKDTFDIEENIIEANEFNALVESYSKNDFNSVIKHGRELKITLKIGGSLIL